MSPAEAQTAIEALQAIDFGYAETAEKPARETLLQYLEMVIDALDMDSPEGNLAIRYFTTDPARSRMYIYGPTDIGDGRGLIEKLKDHVTLY